MLAINRRTRLHTPAFPCRSAVTTTSMVFRAKGMPTGSSFEHAQHRRSGPGLRVRFSSAAGKVKYPCAQKFLADSARGPGGGENSSRLLCWVRLGQPLLGHKDGQQDAGSEDAGQEGEHGKESVCVDD